MVVPESASQGGRSTRRNVGTTPVRDMSPAQHTTRGGSTAPEATPSTRRSTRAASRRLDSVNNTVANPALPEIQTRQSYAYGSSKAPLLPEQLHARESMSVGQVVAQMDSAIQRAEKNLEERVAETTNTKSRPTAKTKSVDPVQQHQEGTQPSKVVRNLEQVQSKKQTAPPAARDSSPVSHTTDVQKQQRTAAWASSLESSQLDDIPEESSVRPESADTHITEPSSFPSGIFDHSYNYERGVRAPRVEPPPVIRTFIKNAATKVMNGFSEAYTLSVQLENGVADWLWRCASAIWKILFELPESAFMALLTKGVLIVFLFTATSSISCFTYKNYLCDPSSSTSISQTLQALCGTCTNTRDLSYNYTISNGNDLSQLTAAIRHINNNIKSIEARLGQRIDSTQASMQNEMSSLRQQHDDLSSLVENLGHAAHPESEIPSPLIPKVNWFSPGMNALVNPYYTSPTREKLRLLPARIVLGLVGVKHYEANGPLTALLPWQDVGDCWCASSTNPGQDRIRIGVEVKEMIYPTELVVEHAPEGSTLTSANAPRDLELWADFGHLTVKQWAELGIESMQMDAAGTQHPIRGSARFAKLADMVYDATSGAHHVQRFKLAVNQFGDLRYAAKTFVVRARTSYGANFGCLYRLRLHGISVAQHAQADGDT